MREFIMSNHLNETGWTYQQHFKTDMFIAREAAKVMVKAFIHAIFPDVKLPGRGGRVIIREMEEGWRSIEAAAIKENEAKGLSGQWVQFHHKLPGDRGYKPSK